jgi:hypothetical protein
VTTAPKTPTQAGLERLQADFPWFAESLLRVRAKSGRDTPLRLNRAQHFLHERLERQLAQTGKVRALVLKGRQQGVSTYMQARFFWRVWGGFGRRAYILTHRQDATQNLFDMTRRFYDRLPPALRPSTSAANERELVFDGLDSGYQVATAGARATGRSATVQLVHGSEVAYWPAAEDHMAGLAQTVPNLPGTEIVLESTANGAGNLLHRLWQSAERGESDYIAVFIPWHWQEEYTRTVPPDFRPTEEESAYARAHGLSPGQVAWRHFKIVDDFAGDVARFHAEYPASAAEAFVAVGHDPLISPALVATAVSGSAHAEGPLIIGVDPARFGGDATAILRRRGRRVLGVERIRKADTMQVAGRIVLAIREERPARVFLDAGGLGAGIFDRLVELGYGSIVTGVQFGESAWRSERYVNRRAEMWDSVRQWLRLGGVSLGGDEVLAAELTGPQYSYDSLGRLKLESKDEMKSRGIASPDAADALALTFAAPVEPLEGSPGTQGVSEAWDELEATLEQAFSPASLPGAYTG